MWEAIGYPSWSPGQVGHAGTTSLVAHINVHEASRGWGDDVQDPDLALVHRPHWSRCSLPQCKL